ncbi:tRNA threonylcarbamoyl adenosine modification protein YeaZ [Streptoalloteichus tenebrarius]|uniref:tRNA threonylcarbamoyl adenosine modification protein YeaZ n=1 Tax=Streptoalloteichus tenebrarius (strain ATCC 17920 / DSM 40477 / JCM 4838 / CBS 697.72 / NBRC 16177 / NCIMB 11028 / NRRL B-12390 / A12253. 1 / ISP 5477) TaxID=1933 RepID=A0ABT1HXD2_STRSD|nr:tRNA (adenosine(37)-N6)-threonylcarbamoyltransferase complex dimerization subunit type 1 TsaB [Streptoalloteichus tenebrarius]MCP2260187.1 tRNA threonylcarbamoyl adenosine modification protein YeaZ [Streptoalloteichus tenebrarius]BFF02610.1 tRNA (adenosine(37)-N6)-threonylcarbamoyltransferase complex dimerization subunit type 1 TsaB [Streptoalloteichus tenebrarius]
MLVLAIDTATPAVTTGLVQLDAAAGPRTLASRVTVNARAHGELLTPQVREVVAEAGAALGDVDALVCGAGPGPFTGLRVGLVTAAALGHALDRPVYPVATPDAIAYDVFRDAPGQELLVVTDARRREVYWARYDETGARVDGPNVERPAELADRLAGAVVRRAAGQGAELYADVLGLPVTAPGFPSPAGLVGAAADAVLSRATPAPLTPLYLRRPDAVEPGARKRVSQS